MSHLARRDNVIFKANSSDATRPDFASGYDVTAYEVGAVVNTNQAGVNKVTVHAGHRIAVGDKIFLNIDPTIFHAISAVTLTTVTLASAATITVSDQDKLVNLGPDSGTTSPSYLNSSAPIYSDPNALVPISNSRVTCNATGEYGYWHEVLEIWELIRNGSGVPVQILTGTADVPRHRRGLLAVRGAAADYKGRYFIEDRSGGSTPDRGDIRWFSFLKDDGTYEWTFDGSAG